MFLFPFGIINNDGINGLSEFNVDFYIYLNQYNQEQFFVRIFYYFL